MTNQIGQLRYKGGGCIKALSTKIDYQSVNIGAAESTSTSFKDVTISPTAAFSKNKDYYLKIAIPQDMNYDMTFNIKLIKVENNSTVVYQFLKNVSLPRGGSGLNVYKVVLYEYENEVRAMLPKTYKAGAADIVPGDIYYRASDDSYWLGKTSTLYERTTLFNEVSVTASWRDEHTDAFGVFELTFRPVEDLFGSILLEMIRTAEDYSIQRVVNGEVEFGRKVDIDKLKQGTNVELYEIIDQVAYIHRGGTLSRIGIWSHPGLVMVINGEEIKIAKSGYYEQDVIPISSLGIVARDYNDNWTLDYIYDTEEEIEEEE